MHQNKQDTPGIKKAAKLAAYFYMVEGGGFEPPKAEPSDLQSDPFGHSGTPPKFG